VTAADLPSLIAVVGLVVFGGFSLAALGGSVKSRGGRGAGNINFGN
jgi:hypothetical protein